MTPEQRVALALEQNLCVACMKPMYGKPMRGCHLKCHRATLRAVEAGKTTLEQRVKQGKLLPAKKGGRPPGNPVTVELDGADLW